MAAWWNAELLPAPHRLSATQMRGNYLWTWPFAANQLNLGESFHHLGLDASDTRRTARHDGVGTVTSYSMQRLFPIDRETIR